jgi:hypothetical protein
VFGVALQLKKTLATVPRLHCLQRQWQGCSSCSSSRPAMQHRARPLSQQLCLKGCCQQRHVQNSSRCSVHPTMTHILSILATVALLRRLRCTHNQAGWAAARPVSRLLGQQQQQQQHVAAAAL